MTNPSRALLEGKTAFVTGAGGGIGLGVARAFQEHGANVVISDVNEAGLAEAMRGLDRDRAAAITLDIVNEAATEAALQSALSRFGQVDVVVPNAGILALKPAIDMSLQEFRRVVDVNLTGAFLTAKIFARHMVDRGAPGSVIFTASLFGLRGGAENVAYSASKFGVVGLTQCFAADLARSRIRVNCVCPGQIDTEMSQRLLVDRAAMRKLDPQDVRKAMRNRIPMGEYGQVSDLAGAYVFLASDLAAYVTGQSVVVDGGWQVG